MPAPLRAGFHFIPLAHRRTDDACAYTRGLAEILGPWIAAAFEDGSMPESDDVTCAIAKTLTETPEWDGFLLALHLKQTAGWPADATLVQLIHRWSCDLKTRAIARSSRRSA